ncbi:MAG: hemolysin family protein [Planctomycetes bacterium]|nr:hemolysin family protein [Planctomycetota bacterium]
MLLLAGILIITMIAVNAFYVAGEFAAVGVRHSRIRALAEDGSRLAARLLPRIEDASELDRYVACCQVGITFSSLMLGAVGQATLTPELAPLLESWFSLHAAAAFSTAAVAVLLALTAAQMVLGELAPKSLALQFPTQTALATVMPMTWSLRLFAWFIVVLNGSGTLILRMLGVRGGGHRHIHSPQEIELLIVESRDGGLLEPEEQHRLHQALRLSQRPASQLMVARLHMATIDADCPPDAVLQRLVDSPYSRFPVVRGSKDNVVGVLYIKDVIARYIEAGSLPPVTQMMRPILTIPRGVTADRLLALFREHRCQQAVLVDEFGGIEGLVTLEDVLTEVFGDFADEFKLPDREPERLPDGRIRAPGAARLDELAPLLGVKLAGEAATVGGLVSHALGRVPAVGERVNIDGVAIEVEGVNKRAVTSVLISRLPEQNGQTETKEAP